MVTPFIGDVFARVYAPCKASPCYLLQPQADVSYDVGGTKDICAASLRAEAQELIAIRTENTNPTEEGLSHETHQNWGIT